MKQYTTPEQTAKLIELGFEKPKFEVETQMCNVKGQPLRVATIVGDYSIGELIEKLPKSLKNPYNPPLAIEYNGMWRVYYGVQEDYSWEWSIWHKEERNELIDALYAMIVKLKEEGEI